MEAANVREAVELATELKASGRYDWFRGQVRNYPLVASFHRRSEAEKDAAVEQIERFVAWVRETPGLEELATQGLDAALAVAQHYGVPTPFIDFTTDPEVAGFFACDAPETNPNELSCIICLDTAHLAEFWKAMPEEWPPPERLVIDVSNLWRLQAQHGVFLSCPYEAVESIYDFDRIFFPASERADEPTRRRMYPTRRSQLEILLDQYFMNERLIEGTQTLHSFPGVVIASPSSGEVDPELIVGGELPVLDSWNDERLRPWRATYDERLADVHTDLDARLRIPAREPTEVAESITAQVAETIERSPRLRSTVVGWRCEAEESFGLEQLEGALNWLWDGLRTLPYAEPELATAIGNCVGLFVAHARPGLGAEKDPWKAPGHPWEAAANALFGESIEVELGEARGSYARSYASVSGLLACIRDDIASYLDPRYRDQLTGNAFGMLQAVRAPARLFEFDRLALLFAHQLAPAQVLMRTGLAVFFSPARVARFGLP